MTGTALTAYDAKLAEMANQYQEQHKKIGGGQFISTQAGQFRVDDQEVVGNELITVILDSVLENTYYGATYDPNNPVPPTCYAYGRSIPEMAPHPSMADHPDYFVPQHEDCRGCPQNVFGSATTGRGKACKNSARLALIPAGRLVPEGPRSRNLQMELFDDPAHFKEATIMYLKVSPTSVAEEWNPYVALLSQAHRRPPLGVITSIKAVPHPKHQFHLKFEMLEILKDDILAVLMASRWQEAQASIISAYTPPDENKPAPQQRGQLRGLRR